MCLALPSRIVSINDLMASVDVHGARMDISLMLLPEPVEPGDFVLIHAGFALQKVEREAALEAHRFVRELAEAGVFDNEEEADH